MGLPSPLPDPAPPKLGVVHGGGQDQFGAIADLAVFNQQARALAQWFAHSLGITEDDFRNDPFITVNCFGLALAWREEMLLQQQIQRDLSERAEAIAGADGRPDFGKAMFGAVKNEVYARHQKAIDRIHMRAARYRDELESLVRKRRLAAQPPSQ